ncbi:MAG: four helix bundle protein [Planctomycetia bacterium]|nr:four helix bundle protein [Planctomycetia bacterium]
MADVERSRSFEDLVVWQRAHTWVLGIYRATADFPKSELYGLTQQLRRASVSVPANIVEGFRRRGLAEKARFYNIAQGSLAESKYFLMLARDLSYGDTTTLLNAADEVDRMLEAYARRIRPNRG